MTPVLFSNLSRRDFAFGDYTPGRRRGCSSDVRALPADPRSKARLGLWGIV